MTGRVDIVEVGPRDGLQNEPREIPVADKVALINMLSRAGFARIECASFVSPKWVPQMAGSDAVLAEITRAPSTRYAALTPNMKGLERAIAAGADEVAVFVSATEGFSRANLNASIDESFARAGPVAAAARAAGLPVRGYVSVVAVCPFEGAVQPAQVAAVAERLADLGVYEVSLGETLGRATPAQIDAMLRAVTARIEPARLAGHFHDTSGKALANIDVALEHGLRVFDAAVGGLGGCPYAPGAAGNVATEAVAAHLAAMGWQTGLDEAVLAEAARMAQAMRGARQEDRV
ncbi:MAG: hydroxymethylglutaryl-CoA lyase [Pseudomonadota bacterium]